MQLRQSEANEQKASASEYNGDGPARAAADRAVRLVRQRFTPFGASSAPSRDDERWYDRKRGANDTGNERQGPQWSEGVDAGTIGMIGLVKNLQMLADPAGRCRARHVRRHDIRAPIRRIELEHRRIRSSAT